MQCSKTLVLAEGICGPAEECIHRSTHSLLTSSIFTITLFVFLNLFIEKPEKLLAVPDCRSLAARLMQWNLLKRKKKKKNLKLHKKRAIPQIKLNHFA